MFSIYTILLLGCSCAVLGYAPPYVQSSEAFIAAKTYVADKLPNRKMDLHNLEDRPHLSFAVLTGVTGGLVLAQDKNATSKSLLEVVDEYVPIVWHAYKFVSQRVRGLMNEATAKVSLVVDLINSVCGAASVAECNAEVDKRVKQSPYIYELPAGLLLSLGKLSTAIRNNELTINSIVNNDNDIPYLIHNVESEQFRAFLYLMKIVYTKLTELTYRRFLTES